MLILLLCIPQIKNAENYLSSALKLVSVTYTCKHFGLYKTRSKGIRPHQKVLPSGCLFEIQFVYDRRLSAYVVRKCHMSHNHQISAAISQHYPSFRCLNTTECQEGLNLLDVEGNTTLVRNYLERKTGKVITNQDIHNMKRKYSCSDNSDENKVFSILQKFLEANGNNVACVVLDDNEATIELIYIQSHVQRECFEKFPELVMVDGTYKVNNVGMSLYDIVVEDGFGDSRVIAYCFVAQETKITIVNFLQIFKKYNPKWEQIKVAITDKDLTEIISIKNVFPPAINLLCQFHMLKYIHTKISSYSADQVIKEQLMELTKKAVYAFTEQQLSDAFKAIEKLSTDFHQCMVNNWLSCKESWCMYLQKDVFTMFNSTTNRIEAHHRVLKLHLKSSSSFSWNLEKLLIIVDQHAHVVSHKEFVEKMYTTVNTSQLSANLQPFFQYCTGYAAH